MLRYHSRKYYNFKKKMFFLLKTQKQPLQQVSGGETQILVLNRMLELFLKVSPLKKILEFQNQKKRLRNLYKRTISNQKSNQWLKTYKMNFINKKTNKQMVLNVVLTTGRKGLESKKGPKPFLYDPPFI